VRYLLIAVTSVTLLGSEASAQDFTRLGSFDNVRVISATGEPHCYGQSLTLWEHQGRIIGLLDVANGLCGDTPCGVLQDVSLERGTGRLTFAATVRSSRFDFVGTVRRDDILGMLNGERVRLERDRDEPDTFESDKDLASWCRTWTRASRCGGVRDLCASLGQPS
jgi:hypothetical protein